jgi:TonB family protein
MYSEFQRLNSYVDAFKNWFPAKVRSKEAIVKLTLVGEKTLNGNSGREYRLSIGDLSGTVQVYATKKRFYAAVVLDAKKDDALQERFLSSFVIPERVIETPTTIARQPPEAPTTVPPPPPVNRPAIDGQKTEPTAEAANTEAKPAEASDVQSAQSGQKRAPISGGVLNGKALYLPKPDYPPEAQSAKASGTVVVQVTIDEQGGVLVAQAVSGHPLLQAAAVAAARQARFSPTTLMGEPVKVTGVITYNFVR